MWSWLKDVAKQWLHTAASHLEQRAFILSLFDMAPPQAYGALQRRIEAMDDEALRRFGTMLASMIGEAQQAAQRDDAGASWGTSFEDRTAQFMAEARAGFPPAAGANRAQLYLQGLQRLAAYAQRLSQEKLARAAPQPPMAAPAPNAEADAGQLERLIEHFVETGALDPSLVQRLVAIDDEAAMDRILAKLKALGADEGPSPPLNIADHYRPGTAKYQLQWPLSPTLRLPVPFDRLDRQTQFYVLFGEWSRRELEANQALCMGDTAGAQAVFEECLARAEQLDVAELKARSYEGLVRVAQKRGDPQAARRWLDAALAARANG
jgi:hypothetical protein